MSEPAKTDRWNSLLETLGVPVSEPKPADAPVASPAAESAPEGTATAPTAAGRPPIVSMLRPEKPKAAAKPSKPAAAKPAPKSPSYWSRIAGALGLEVPPEPEPPPEPVSERALPSTPSPPPVSAGPPADVAAEGLSPSAWRTADPGREPDLPPRAFERPRRERPERQSRPPRGERPPREDRPPPREDRPPPSEAAGRSPLDEMFGEQRGDVDVFGLANRGAEPPPRQSGDLRGRGDEESGAVLDYGEESGADLSFENLSDAEFGPRDEAGSQRDEGRRRRRRRGRGRRGRGEAREEAAPPRREADIEPAGEEVDFDLDRDEEFELDADMPLETERERGPERSGRRDLDDDLYGPGSEQPEDEREPGARRGRRRRGRRGGETPAGERPTGYRRDETGERYSGRKERGPAPARTVRESTEDDSHLSDELEDGDDEHAGGLPTHKKIPTWEDAVRILIDTNMAARQNNPDRDHRGRGRGRR